MLDKMSAPTSLASLMNATIVKPKDSMSQTQIKSLELIDSKFNELAKKILEEFAQVQYSNDFFQALDEVLKEPISKTFTHNHRIGQKLKYFNRKVSRQSSMNSTSGSCFNHPSQAADQPRSLPVEAARQLTGRLQQQQQQQQQQRVSARQKSAVPASTISDGYNQANIVKRSSPIESHTSNRPTHPMAKSATIGDTLSKRQPALRKSPSATGSPKAASVLVKEPKLQVLAQTQQQQQHQPLTQKDINHRTRIHSTTTNSLAKKVARPIRAYNDFGDSDDSNEDDDLDDLDDIDDFEDDLEYLSSSDRGFNPIVKSKTASDATNISEINYNLSSSKPRAAGNAKQQQQQLAQKQSHQQERTLKPYQPVVQKQEQKLYPVVRSNTIGNASLDRASNQRDHLAEPRSATLNSKDIGSLYKPHMNYSTSVLGNHRLSDDDEIIIIPTQSPSLISNSPDGDANADDPSERFSISRTKSFWERLSKGNPNKRALKYAETGPGAETLDDDPTLMNSSNNNKTNALHYQQHNGGNKVIGVRADGHSHNLDRMDSTGGSNSNYSCSSSGDENGGGSQSQRARPMTDQLLEINRQNRFRQTR